MADLEPAKEPGGLQAQIGPGVEPSVWLGLIPVLFSAGGWGFGLVALLIYEQKYGSFLRSPWIELPLPSEIFQFLAQPKALVPMVLILALVIGMLWFCKAWKSLLTLGVAGILFGLAVVWTTESLIRTIQKVLERR